MPLPDRDFRVIGPREGQPFPDSCLSDQAGTLVDLHRDRAGRPALVVFCCSEQERANSQPRDMRRPGR